MIEIPISYLQPGQINDQPYFSEDGKVIIPSRTVLTLKDLTALKNSGLTHVYVQGSNEDEDLIELLNVDFESTGPGSDLPHTDIPEIPFEITSKPGKEGLIELQKNPRCQQLDSLIFEISNSNLPCGPAFKNNIIPIKKLHRSPDYKNTQLSDYDNALQETEDLLHSLASGKSVSVESVRSISSHFARLFLKDPDFILNLSNLKPLEGEYLFHHSLNVCIIAINIAAASGCSEPQVTEIGMGALLHDIGMLLIPQEIRFKSSRASADEWYEIQKHPITGVLLLDKIKHLPDNIMFMVYQSHERENGKGYPKQRSSRLIHTYAKILAVADTFEALSSPRSHREAYLPYKAMETLIKMTRQGLLCGTFVKALLEFTSLFPVGSVVELNNKCIGRVIKPNGTSFAKPVVCILMDEKGNVLEEKEQYIEDLMVNTSLQIVKVHQNTMFNLNILLGF